MERHQIYKIYGTDYVEMTKRLLIQADLIGQIPNRDCRIGIKPNLVSPSEASFGATTHPEVVAGILEYLQERGCRNLVIMEGSWVGDKTSEAVRVCGYDRLAKQYGVPFLDTQKEPSMEKDCAGLKLNLCRCVEETDFLINVPVMKGHCQTKMTCALKNMKGLIPNKEKRRFHAMGLHRPIAHLAAGIRQDFVVVDHICGDLDFEDGGNPVVKNCILAARDPVLVDAYVCGLLHYDCAEVPYIGMAQAIGAGSADLSRASIRVLFQAPKQKSHSREKASEVCGREEERSRKLEAARRDEKGTSLMDGWFVRTLAGEEIWDEELPYAEKTVAVRDLVEEVESCSACYGYLIPALDRLRQEGLLERLHEKICIGQGYRGRTGRLGVGQCTAGFEFCVKGCPPVEEEIYEALKTYLLSE